MTQSVKVVISIEHSGDLSSIMLGVLLQALPEAAYDINRRSLERFKQSNLPRTEEIISEAERFLWKIALILCGSSRLALARRG